MSAIKPSFKYIRVGMTCCGDDWIQTESSRYDLERLGCAPANHAEEANLLVIQGAINDALRAEIEIFYEKMVEPRLVMALGTCACGGGLFPFDRSPSVPVNVYVTGCPPRPEAIMNGVISLRELQK
jgi:NADH:ubiquinone oxidoreductase subunit B-like Fe-S oxidoreductase